MKKKDIRESEVEGHLRRSVESMGGQCVKFLPDYKRGWPDRILLLRAVGWSGWRRSGLWAVSCPRPS